MSSTLRQRMVFALLAAAVVAWEAHAIVAPAREVFPTAWTARDLDAFGRAAVVSQVFTVGAEVEPLAGVSVLVRGSGAPARVEWTLEESTGSERHVFTVLYRGTESVRVDGEEWVALTFPPTSAWNREFRLSLRLLDLTPPPLAVRYSPTGAYPGMMAVNGREELGDFLLTATGESLLARVRRLSAARGDSVGIAVAAGVALLYHVALFGFLFLLVSGPRGSRDG